MMGEDVFFFHKMRHFTDHRLFIDHDASQHVSHIGTFEYSNALADATWDEIEHGGHKSEDDGMKFVVPDGDRAWQEVTISDTA